MSENNTFKPAGYNSLSPYLIVNGAENMVRMLEHVFQASMKRKFERPGGKLTHAELLIDDSVIMLSEASDSFPANQFLLHVYVPDAIAIYQRAIDYGCTGIQAPVRKEDDPDVRGMFRDFAGNIWAVSTQQADASE